MLLHIDGHNDFPIRVRASYGSHIYSANFTRDFEEGGMLGHVDIPRIKKGMYGGAFWSAWTPCPSERMDFSNENYEACQSFHTRAPYPSYFDRLPLTRLISRVVDL